MPLLFQLKIVTIARMLPAGIAAGTLMLFFARFTANILPVAFGIRAIDDPVGRLAAI
ncbi:hypothetical protein GCM10007968_28130 [Sporolactobacillus putidus]|uniref:Uncharacterized protein n=1 Tax=Sporolactobacillus putidus TaxID=492735 RepID=A0A917S9A2_9BACL|nr:hypothetical protein GCM10007968_28130 [Sporolactobacillus putidus]